MISARTIADNLAAALAASNDVATATLLPPRVFLNAIGEQVEFDDGRPIILVAPASAENLLKGDRTADVRVIIAVDTTAGRDGNSAASEQRQDGVFVCADSGAELEALESAVLGVAQAGAAPALLNETSAEYDFSNGPIHAASLTLSFIQFDHY